MTRSWVVLETGANQDYIFDSNRMRHVVGASQLVLDVGTAWVEQACEGQPGLERVQAVSGKAVLLVESPDVGHAVIRKVSYRALTEAPGLEVTGVVGPEFDETAPYLQGTAAEAAYADPPPNHVVALRQTLVQQGQARADRPARQLRDRYLPWHEPCRETGMPVQGYELFGQSPREGDDWHPASAATLARSQARRDPLTKERLEGLLGSHQKLLPELVDDLADDGWIAVVHADGNGVGMIFHDFADRIAAVTGRPEVTLTEHSTWLRDFSDQLDAVTKAAFTAAVETVVSTAGREPDWWKGRLLPILLGGDDVTFACHAGLALPLVREFLREFSLRTRADDVIAKISRQRGLSGAAGVAIVKPHHPFSAAYDLAEDLTASAKREAVRRCQEPVSAYDVHIAHESTLRPLRELRADLRLPKSAGGPVARHGGPYVVAVPGQEVPAVLADRDEGHLTALMDLLAGGALSSARAHDLRGALDRGVAEYRSRLEVALARTATEHDLRDGTFDRAAAAQLLGVVPAGDGVPFVRLVDALLLHGVAPRGAQLEVVAP